MARRKRRLAGSYDVHERVADVEAGNVISAIRDGDTLLDSGDCGGAFLAFGLAADTLGSGRENARYAGNAKRASIKRADGELRKFARRFARSCMRK